MNLGAIADEMRRFSKAIDKAIDEVERASVSAAEADADYRQAWALAFLQSEGKTVKEREAEADIATHSERRNRNLTDAVKVGALEALRSRRTQVSGLQSLLSAHREEAAFARTGPEVR